MQGIYIQNERGDLERPATKKALKAVVASERATGQGLGAVHLEATSMFGNEYGGPLADAPAGEYYVVGPDPYTSRKWYATISVSESTPKVRVS